MKRVNLSIALDVSENAADHEVLLAVRRCLSEALFLYADTANPVPHAITGGPVHCFRHEVSAVEPDAGPRMLEALRAGEKNREGLIYAIHTAQNYPRLVEALRALLPAAIAGYGDGFPDNGEADDAKALLRELGEEVPR